MIEFQILILSLCKVNRKMRHQTEEIKLSNILKKKSLTIQCSLRYLVNTECLLQPCTLFIQVLHVCVFVSHQTVQYTGYTLHGAVQWITLVVLIQHFKVYLNVACCVHISFTLYVNLFHNHVLKSYNVEQLANTSLCFIHVCSYFNYKTNKYRVYLYLD